MNIRKGIYKTLVLLIKVIAVAWGAVFALSFGGLIPLMTAFAVADFNLWVVLFYVASWSMVVAYNSLDDADEVIERTSHALESKLGVNANEQHKSTSKSSGYCLAVDE